MYMQLSNTDKLISAQQTAQIALTVYIVIPILLLFICMS